jgi:hypothetical protein
VKHSVDYRMSRLFLMDCMVAAVGMRVMLEVNMKLRMNDYVYWNKCFLIPE